MRHAERPAIPAGSFGHDLSITPEGRHRAQEFGREIGARLGRVVSSPVPRCVQTATAILVGSGIESQVETDRRLGDPGPWIADPDAAGRAFLTHGSTEVVRLQLAGKAAGMQPLAQGSATLLTCLFSSPSESSTIDVFVSHDAVIAPMLGHLLDTVSYDAIWPAFLEAARFTRGPNGVVLHWRGMSRAISPEVCRGR